MKKQILYYILPFVLAFCFAPIAFGDMTSTSYRITTSVLSGGGVPMSSASYESDSSMGQPSPLMDPSDPPGSTICNNSPGFWHTAADNDGDGLLNTLEDTVGLDSGDADYDDDGILDGAEDADHDGVVDGTETDPGNLDSDGDGIQDGTERGYTMSDIGGDTYTGVGGFIPDADDGATTTDPLDEDSDDDTWLDGQEDTNYNGEIDTGESDPNSAGSVPGATIPTMSEWGMIVFFILLVGSALWVIRRRTGRELS